MEIVLEDKIGYQIHKLVREGRINPAADLAFQEFGYKRAFKIYVNAGRLRDAKKLAYQKGLIAEFDYLCREIKFKVNTQGPNGTPISYGNSKQGAKHNLERKLAEEVELPQ